MVQIATQMLKFSLEKRIETKVTRINDVGLERRIIMGKSKWSFSELPSVMVITTKNIVKGKLPILSVFHDDDDGMWQFLDGIEINEDRVMIISMEEIVRIDDTVQQLADLPLGWVAWRDSVESPWQRQRDI